MKPLLAIFSCHAYKYTTMDSTIRDWFTRPRVDRVSAIRDTWVKDVTIDYKFFYGRGKERLPQPDEVFLDAPDDYLHSAWKLQALIQWALAQGYDTLCKIDDDVYVYWDRLVKVGLQGGYSGHITGESVKGFIYGHVVNGFTYWLSKQSMEILAHAPIHIWAEDRWASDVLHKHRVTPVHNRGYYLAPSTRTNQWITEEDLSERRNTALTIHSMSPAQMRSEYVYNHNCAQQVP